MACLDQIIFLPQKPRFPLGKCTVNYRFFEKKAKKLWKPICPNATVLYCTWHHICPSYATCALENQINPHRLRIKPTGPIVLIAYFPSYSLLTHTDQTVDTSPVPVNSPIQTGFPSVQTSSIPPSPSQLRYQQISSSARPLPSQASSPPPCPPSTPYPFSFSPSSLLSPPQI